MSSSDEANVLRELEAAYAAGNFAKLRQLAERVRPETGADAGLIAGAQAMRARTVIDPITIWVLACCALLFCGIVLHYVF